MHMQKRPEACSLAFFVCICIFWLSVTILSEGSYEPDEDAKREGALDSLPCYGFSFILATGRVPRPEPKAKHKRLRGSWGFMGCTLGETTFHLQDVIAEQRE